MEVYFDDLTLRHIKSPVLQHDEYYPFGLQTANSWTRENTTTNNYLANGGTLVRRSFSEGGELNQTSQLYDLHYRNYDPALGRMFQVDPMASKYGSITPYNYSLNNPPNINDPLGDDVEPQPQTPREYICAMCWRSGDSRSLYMFVNGGGGPESGWSYRQSGINSANTFWHRDIVEMKEDAFTAHSTGNYADFGAKYGATIYEKGAGAESSAEIFNPWIGAEVSRTADNTITYAGGWMKMDPGIMAKLMVKGYQVNIRNVGKANRFYADGGQQTQGGVLQAGFGFGEGLGSLELALAGLKPTFDGAAYMARLQGGAGEVPLFLKKNIFQSPLIRGNNALYVGRVSSSTAIGTASTLSKLAPALTVAGVLTNGYDIVKDGRLTAGDGFQAINTGLMVAFPVYGVMYGVVDLGFAVFSDQSLTDRIKSGIDSNISASYKF